ncbi:MAG: hypothetical protein PF690_17325 [Deltaproteobacteria bacterium]|jgi:hypothetical protein|nr:hypothetical protein [Deltaproteobacteria bacterium]
MDKLKLKAIEHFAAKPHDDEKAQAFLHKEYKAIHGVLSNSCVYEEISDALSTLEKFISHVAKESIEDLLSCWSRLHELEELILSDTTLTKYHTKHKLFTKIVGLLGRLRYIEQESVITILLRFWSEDKSIKTEIKKVFKNIAEYNLHAVEKIGFAPQLMLLERLMQLTEKELQNYFELVVTFCSESLSTEIEGNSWEYRKLSMKFRAIPANDDIRKIRSNSVALLQQLYTLNSSVARKKELLNRMNGACRKYSRSPMSDEARKMVEQNTVDVLSYWTELIKSESLELIQKIEHDAYWNYYHASGDEVKNAALEVKKAIDTNKEYEIYRDLVGFEGIFGSWEEEKNIKTDYENKQMQREERVKIHTDGVNDDNVNEWLCRVETYLETDSQDLATFPELFKFVESMAKKFPVQVVNHFSNTSKMDKAAIPLIRGVWESEYKDKFIEQISNWIDANQYLYELSASFGSFSNLPESLINKLLDKVLSEEDFNTLSSCLRFLEDKKNDLSEELINQIVSKIFLLLNQRRNTDWINYVWFSRKSETFINSLSEDNVALLVNNLVYVSQIDHRVEYLLEHIAEIDVDSVFSFFEKRVAHSQKTGNEIEEHYEAIPFSLSSINKVISEYPEKLISFIKNNYEYQYGVDEYGAASLFKKCISPFQPEMTDLMLEQLDPTAEDNLLVLLAIVTCYDGHSSILCLIKRLLSTVKLNENLTKKINSSLLSLGVVSGEYGLAEAYKRKIADIEPWLTNDNRNVVEFTKQYVDLLNRMVEQEVRRTDERVALEKHQYGVDE